MHSRSLLACSLLALAGCSAIVSPDPTRLGGSDAGRLDAATNADAFIPPGTDAWSPDRPDAWSPDLPDAWSPVVPDAFVPPTCVEGSVRCDGSVRVACVGGREQRMLCPSGTCNPATGACSTAPDACAGLPTIALGDTHTFNLCDATGMTTFTRTDACSAGSPADSSDATFVLEIREPTSVLIDLQDADGSVAIDTVVYVRRTCDAPDTQLACSDDVPCSSSAIPCFGGERVQVRQSRIVTRLEPGTYYVVADAFLYDSFDCGDVTLTVTTP